MTKRNQPGEAKINLDSPEPKSELGSTPVLPPESEASAHNPEDRDSSPESLESLQNSVDIQNSGPNPDAGQVDGDWPSTEGSTGATKRRSVTIDPATGQVHYAGDVSSLPGGTVAHEGDGQGGE